MEQWQLQKEREVHHQQLMQSQDKVHWSKMELEHQVKKKHQRKHSRAREMGTLARPYLYHTPSTPTTAMF